MKKNPLLLFSLIIVGQSIVVMGNNNPNSGDAAIKNYPKAWLATKVAGGAAGTLAALVGFSAYIAPSYARCLPLPIRLLEGTFYPKSRLGQLINIVMFAFLSGVSGGWKGGEAVSRAKLVSNMEQH